MVIQRIQNTSHVNIGLGTRDILRVHDIPRVQKQDTDILTDYALSEASQYSADHCCFVCTGFRCSCSAGRTWFVALAS